MRPLLGASIYSDIEKATPLIRYYERGLFGDFIFWSSLTLQAIAVPGLMRYFSKPLSPPLSKGGRGDGEGFGAAIALPYQYEKGYIRSTQFEAYTMTRDLLTYCQPPNLTTPLFSTTYPETETKLRNRNRNNKNGVNKQWYLRNR